MGRFFAISDIHITDSKDPAYRKLLTFVSQAQTGDLVFLGGDVFDFLGGDQPILTREYSEFIKAVSEKIKSGARFLYVEGNHDFHLKFLTRKIPGLELSPESFSVDFEGKRFYLAHGDLVDQEDRKYLMLRKFFRSPFIRTAAKVLPGRLVAMIGAQSDKAFGDQTSKTPEARPSVRLTKTREKFRDFAERKFAQGFDFVVLGHCHDLDEYRATEKSKPVHYMNVGFPKKHETFVFWEPGMSSLERKPF